MRTSASTPRFSDGQRPTIGRLTTSALLIGALGLITLPGCDDADHRSATLQRATKPDGHKTDRFTIAATGDFLLHRVVMDQAASDVRTKKQGGYDFMPMLTQLNPLIRQADLGICHIE